MRERLLGSTTHPVAFLLVASSDHVTAVTGAAPAVSISKDGAAFGAASGAVSELANGWYSWAGNATDRGTLGGLAVHVTATGADPADFLIDVVPWDPFSDLAAANADALLDRANAVETGVPPRAALRLILAALAGKLSGAAGTTVTIRNVGDTKDRITATVDASGNRTAISTDTS